MKRLPEPVLIDKPYQLSKLVAALRHERIIAVDTESNSLYAYQEQVCLIQFSTTEDDYLVDPLALDDLSSLEPIFSSTEIEKVFHAAEYDLICLSRDFGFTFTNLFDTMVAARILGREAVGLGSMLEDEFGVRTDKRFQRADWGRRPLPTDMKNYARMDTRYLIPLRDHLLASLHQTHLWALAKEDFDLLCQVNGYPVNGEKKNIEEPWGIRGAVDLTPQGAAVLLDLCRYRDKVARRINRPLFKVINNQTLLVIASDSPRNLHELGAIQGMSPKQVRRHGNNILRAVKRGLRLDPIYPPKYPKHSVAYLQRMDRLRQWRKYTAQDMGVQSDVVMPRALLEKLARQRPTDEQELASILSDVPWRLDKFGSQILEELYSD